VDKHSTGGVGDKLSLIIVPLVAVFGGVITAAGDEMAPADRRLYALRDITATVDSIPLIASSIMSKKVAEGTQSLLLDIKVGSGAFMTDAGQARLLGSTMIEIGQAHGVRTAAMLTAMDTPLGRAVGNAVEVGTARRRPFPAGRGQGRTDRGDRHRGRTPARQPADHRAHRLLAQWTCERRRSHPCPHPRGHLRARRRA
jgi:thymidine phosphorylase